MADTLQAPTNPFEKTLKTRKKLQAQVNQATSALDDLAEELEELTAVEAACNRLYRRDPDLLAATFNNTYSQKTSRMKQVLSGLGGAAAGALAGAGAAKLGQMGFNKFQNYRNQVLPPR